MTFMELAKVLLYWVAELDDIGNMDVDIQFHSNRVVVTDKSDRKKTLAQKLDMFHTMSAMINSGGRVPYDLFYSRNGDVWQMTLDMEFETQSRAVDVRRRARRGGGAT